MRPLRVCQLITELAPGGAERCLFELSRRLDENLFDVQVIGLRDGEVADWLRDAAVEVTVLGMGRKWDLLKLAGLAGLLRRRRIDILHTHLFHADLAGRPAACLAAVPCLVHTVHVAEGRFRPWHFAYGRFLGGCCDRIVCVSSAVRDYHARRSGLPRWRYTVIPNGIEVESFARHQASRRRLRGQWGIGRGDVLMAFVGRLDRQKGIDTLLSVMSHLCARGEAVNLVIAGDGPQRFSVQNFMEHGPGGDRTRWLGFVKDVRAVLSAADILVMPSRWEGFGLAAAEAMAAGLPVVATRVPGLAQLVLDGRTGFLIDRGDVVGLCEAIERLAGDSALRRKLGRAGRKRVAEDFDIDDNVAAHQALYAEVFGGRKASWSARI